MKLYHYQRDSIIEFYDLLEPYLNRNRGTKFQITVDEAKLSENLYRIILGELTKRKIPKNYLCASSNMEKQAYYDPIPAAEYELFKSKAKKQAEKDYRDFINELNKINAFENFEIVIEK